LSFHFLNLARHLRQQQGHKLKDGSGEKQAVLTTKDNKKMLKHLAKQQENSNKQKASRF
jgi:hypothetical protein